MGNIDQIIVRKPSCLLYKLYISYHATFPQIICYNVCDSFRQRPCISPYVDGIALFTPPGLLSCRRAARNIDFSVKIQSSSIHSRAPYVCSQGGKQGMLFIYIFYSFTVTSMCAILFATRILLKFSESQTNLWN